MAPSRPLAVLLDAAGTLLHPREPVARTYRDAAVRYGDVPPEPDVAARLVDAMRDHRPLRTGDDRWFRYWGSVIEAATGRDEPELLDQLWVHYARPDAWEVADGAEECCRRLRVAGIRLAVVSNWDVRLRPLLRDLGIADWFDTIVVSAEEGVEKPDPEIFHRACQRLGVEPAAALMIGDSPKNDVEGARAAGLDAQRFTSFHALLPDAGTTPPPR